MQGLAADASHAIGAHMSMPTAREGNAFMSPRSAPLVLLKPLRWFAVVAAALWLGCGGASGSVETREQSRRRAQPDEAEPTSEHTTRDGQVTIAPEEAPEASWPTTATSVPAPRLVNLQTRYGRFCSVTDDGGLFCGVGAVGERVETPSRVRDVHFTTHHIVIRTDTAVLIAEDPEQGPRAAFVELPEFAGATALGAGYGTVCAVVGGRVRCRALTSAQALESPTVDAVDLALVEDGSSERVLCALTTRGTIECSGCTRRWADLYAEPVSPREGAFGMPCTASTPLRLEGVTRLEQLRRGAFAATTANEVYVLPNWRRELSCHAEGCACRGRRGETWDCMTLAHADDSYTLRDVRVLGAEHALLADGRLVHVTDSPRSP